MTHRQRQQRRRRRRGKGRVALLTVGVLVTAVVIGALSVVGYIVAIAATAPDLDELQPIDKGASSVIYAADGSRLGYVQSDVIRTPISWRRMPTDLRRATVAIEDSRFYEHKGVDYESIVRAAIKNLESGRSLQGGSTITQQLVRALYIKDPKRDIERKIREAKLASELEQQRSKRWILREYLNSVPYGTVNGRTAVGVEAASSVYFGKHASQLDLHEAAMIAGLPQAPSQYNPFRNPTAALERRNEVLEAMADNRYITREEAADAARQPLGLDPGRRYTSRREPYFFDFVQEQLIEKYGVNAFRQGGLKIHTTIDPKLQAQGRTAIQNRLNQPGDPSSAVVSIDPSNGYIRAMATSGTYNDRTFNLAAQGHRQPGSAFKTMALVTALRQGVNPNSTTYVSKPLQLDLGGYIWRVATYGNQYGGRMNLVRATLKSDNTVYAQLAVDLGPENVAETARLMGIRTRLDGFAGETLGGLKLGVSPLEMASAYATLAAGGMYSEPKAITRVEFPDGKSEELGEPERKRVFSDGVAYEATKILRQNVEGGGTGGNARIGCPAAGKTGTTDNFADAWFVGYTPTLATSVWVGYPNARVEMQNVHGIQVNGGSFPAQIWHDFMIVAKGNDCGSFPAAENPVQFKPFFGKYSRTGTPSDRNYDSTQQGNGGTSAGGENYQGYDPRLYETPPQQAPAPTPPEAPRGNGNGGGGGGNRGGGNGDGGDGNSGGGGPVKGGEDGGALAPG